MAEVLLRRRSLGDVVLLGAVTAAVPGCVVVTEERYRPVAERLRGVAGTLPWSEAGRVRGEVVDLQRDAATLRAHPLARRLRKHTVRRALSVLGFPVARPSVAASYGRAVGVRPVPPPWIDAPGGTALALVPGASTPLKAWSPERLAAVGRGWGGEVVVVGGPGEEEVARRVARGVPGAELVVEDGFARTLEALGRCAVVVGGDTGLVHLAAACGARPVVVFGPTHPRDGYYPYPAMAALGLELPCRPCTRHRRATCHEGHAACVEVDAGRVLDTVLAGRTP